MNRSRETKLDNPLRRRFITLLMAAAGSLMPWLPKRSAAGRTPASRREADWYRREDGGR